MNSGQLRAPAKLNLTLEVLARRPNGYHALRSVVVPIGMFDVLRWRPAERFAFTCSDAALAGDDNLVVRAAYAVELDRLPLALHLEKVVPYGSGLGGGSSDAAAVLLAAMHGAFGPQPPRDWLAVARALGSDVPLFLVDAPALIEGTGERVTALGAAPDWWAVLVFPSESISTRAAYAALDAAPRRDHANATRADSVSLRMTQAFQRRAFDDVATLASNDFEATAFANPVLAAVRDAFGACAAKAHLSGSGSCIFDLRRTQNEAEALAAALAAQRVLHEHAMRVYPVPFAIGSSFRGETA